MDTLLDEARGATDVAKRRADYFKVWAELRRDLPLTYLYNPRNIVAMSAKLQGYRPVPDGMIRYAGPRDGEVAQGFGTRIALPLWFDRLSGEQRRCFQGGKPSERLRST